MTGVIRKEGDYQLNKAVNGMFNVTDQANDISLIATARMRVSNWFNEREADEMGLLSGTKEAFETKCEELLTD